MGLERTCFSLRETHKATTQQTCHHRREAAKAFSLPFPPYQYHSFVWNCEKFAGSKHKGNKLSPQGEKKKRSSSESGFFLAKKKKDDWPMLRESAWGGGVVQNWFSHYFVLFPRKVTQKRTCCPLSFPDGIKKRGPHKTDDVREALGTG